MEMVQSIPNILPVFIQLLINGTEVWLHYDVKVKFDGHFKDDVKLLTI
jgi:hypothetical protein